MTLCVLFSTPHRYTKQWHVWCSKPAAIRQGNELSCKPSKPSFDFGFGEVEDEGDDFDVRYRSLRWTYGACSCDILMECSTFVVECHPVSQFHQVLREDLSNFDSYST